jgi:UDP-N-acetylmuramate-alanine ligase
VTGELVADAAREAGASDVRYREALEGLADVMADELGEGDVVCTLGAGSVESLGPELLARLEEGSHA